MAISKGSSDNTLNVGNDYGSWMTSSTRDLEVNIDSGDAVSSGGGGKSETKTLEIYSNQPEQITIIINMGCKPHLLM